MSRRGNCWDNAVAESFFSSLKKERIRKKSTRTAKWRSTRSLTTSIRSTIRNVDISIWAGLAQMNMRPLPSRLSQVSTDSWELQKKRRLRRVARRKPNPHARVGARCNERNLLGCPERAYLELSLDLQRFAIDCRIAGIDPPVVRGHRTENDDANWVALRSSSSL